MQKLFTDNLPDLVIASTTTITMASTNIGKPTRITVGGQQYKYTSLTTLNFASTGFNGLDTGAIAANTLYYIYAVQQSGVPGLVASTAAPTTGPSGFTAFKQIAKARTATGGATLDSIGNALEERAYASNVYSDFVRYRNIQASTSNGVSFKNLAGTEVGSFSDNARFVLGNSTSTDTLTVKVNDSASNIYALILKGENSFGGSGGLAWQDSWGGDGGAIRVTMFGDVPSANNGRFTLKVRKSGVMTTRMDVNELGRFQFYGDAGNYFSYFVGTLASNSDAGIRVFNNVSFAAGIFAKNTSGSTCGFIQMDNFTANSAFIWYNGTTLYHGNVYGNIGTTTGTSISSYSDSRIKSDIEASPYGLNMVLSVEPKKFKLNADMNRVRLGFLAQDLQEHAPESVYNTGNSEGENEDLLAIDHHSTQAILWQAVKDQHAIIQSLQSRIEVLEGA